MMIAKVEEQQQQHEQQEEDSTAQTHHQEDHDQDDSDTPVLFSIGRKSGGAVNSEDDDEDKMIDLEQGNILKELEERSRNRNNNNNGRGGGSGQGGGRISGNSSVASLSDQIDQSTRFWSMCLRTTTDSSGKVTYQYRWVFSIVIILLGAAATTIVLLLGLDGVRKNSEQQFIHEATQLTNVLELSWRGYESLALWIHESCHYNIYEADVQLHYNKSTINSLTAQNLLDDGIALREGFCSRDKFRYVLMFLPRLFVCFMPHH